MTVSYVDPSAEKPAPPEAYTRRLDTARRPLTLGLIANAFPDGTNFMDCVERALADVLPGVALRRYQKPSVGPLAPQMLADIVRDCDGVLAGWGH